MRCVETQPPELNQHHQARMPRVTT